MSDPFIYDDEIKALNALDLPDNAVVFDIGCSYGEYTLEVVKKMNGRPFTVHAFDPVADFCQIQRERFDKIPTMKFFINNYAVSDEIGEKPFIRIKAPGNQAAEGCSTLYTRKCFFENKAWQPAMRNIIVTLTTLDKYIYNNNINHIDLMKIDVEGNELRILKGGRMMFMDKKVDVIQFEYNDSWKDSGATMREVIDFVTRYGYYLADYINGFIRVENFVEDYGFHNYYLLHEC